ncbi:hypothetical protein MIT9_P1691 [Methylomarinovum caldicuralii]|uniref:Tetratricopeptide repeat protein n=1 Tax=Methylomarinovum caldicuralii TaxID=438856 RepID=A0AAU9CRE6_9GAMM|nr:tetratricopeptide repeat protein [Methylomarinovum caldicuralii]BCX82107.1 hypothetical protein MIT9_P1691 [Methylomarinovum caldicuralii]
MHLEILYSKAEIKLATVLLAALSLVPLQSQALPPWPEALRGYWKEIRTPEPVPVFCEHTLSPKSGPGWRGPGLSGVNHYCDSKVKHHICLRYSGKDRRACLVALAKGINDLIANAKQKKLNNHPMLPYLYTEYGNFFNEAGDYFRAIQEYLTAIRKNRKYLPAYIRLADAFIRTKQYDKAEKTLKYALKIQKNPRHEAYIKKKLARIKKLKSKS